ncbi:type I-B CRISPR-associated protein Cas7/Cst2/DevR [Actinomadura atramentaria]|uniref:type I-B CRISPR-associated protein Cas7/Cst2/DevR n=1 Tax=Actinomadura atramentaria TaxID=1990 RepID=UPI00035C0D79|nr:type I-B CRISPR-associated protein Cas7/Cst2/DevR [Actinomadura atramentaria]
MTFLSGKIALDVVAGAPNNGRGEDNVAKVKQMYVGRAVHPYVSAQAFRRWLRDSFPAAEPRSPVIRTGASSKQQAYTAGRPDLYLDDDLFGYMVALKKNAGTCQRDTVVANGTLVSVAPRKPSKDFGTMSRGFGAGENPVIHEHEFYTAELAADLLFDLPRVGVFEVDGSGLKVALTAAAAAEAEKAGAEPATLRGVRALKLPLAERRRRAALFVRALAGTRGGAKRSLHYGDRTPAFVLLAPMKGGVNPFTRVFGVENDKVVFRPDVLREEFEAWRDEIDGPITLGWAPGFLGKERDRAEIDLGELTASGALVFGHPRTVLRDLGDAFENGDHDAWFEDPDA